MKISAHIPDRIKRTSRCVGFALWLGGTDDFLGLVPIFRVRLSEDERAGLAYAALRSLENDHACWVADASSATHTGIQESFGRPQALLSGFMDQATFWADMADPQELEAYCLASFKAMPRGRQAAFLDYVQGRPAA